MPEIPINQWKSRLEAVLDGDGSPLGRLVVLSETDSTQDAARRLDVRPADVVIAGRQTGGRGRRGKVWADPDGHGIAVTIASEAAPPQLMMTASAVGVAQAAETLIGRSVGIKWPNDIVVGGRKLAGILVEQSGPTALIGIGMNVGQTRWSNDLAKRAVSLAQLGVEVDRFDALRAVLVAMRRVLRLEKQQLIEGFVARDWLKGRRATFRARRLTVTGTVLETDPMRGLLVQTDAGKVRLPAATTTLEALG
ncbi:MAG: biotin--[acetyl-CoA-carboxylase] ligase [Planctomycetota bacterium]|jgi:BirA family biotin operon repressor/biotin-[acetyl-CoA-carboxylase] ligase